MSSEITTYQGNCEKHGEFTGNVLSVLGREIRSGCKECKAEQDAQEAERKRASDALLATYRLAQKLGDAAIPPRFKGKRFGDYIAQTDKQKKALQVCTEYADNFSAHLSSGRCLLLMGKPGCGKTHLAAAIAGQICEQTNYDAVYRSMPGLVHEIRATYDGGSDRTEGQIIQAITRCELLVLDEIGATKTSEFELALLFSVINARYERQLPTVVVSNLAPSELSTAIGERCVDRLREGGGIVVAFDWESKRRELK